LTLGKWAWITDDAEVAELLHGARERATSRN